jgi:hypothetical protein
MITYLSTNQINKEKWDQCIRESVNRLVYAYSWYLDIVCPGWDALVENDYESVFPLPNNRKAGIRYIFQPYFAQQLGIFSRNILNVTVVDNFLKTIPSKFQFVEIHLNTLNKIDETHYQSIERTNHELDLINSYEFLYANYDQNTKRNTRKALQEKLILRRKVEPDELITLFRENWGKKEVKLHFHQYDILRRLIDYLLKHTFSMITGAYLPDGTLCAAVFFLRDENRVIYQLAASNNKARENGAMFLLVDSFIKEHAGQPLILDFEGSNDKNVARFYKGFGAKAIHYSQVKINRLPGVVSKMVNFVRKHRDS